MSSLSGVRIVIVGAGVLGLAAASALVRRGARVQIVDPDGGRGSASAAAAGMIAPAMEAVLEDATADRAALYRDAAALWPAFAVEYGLELAADGVDWLGPREPIRGRLAALGYPFNDLDDRLHVPGEARLDVRAALRSLAAAVGGQDAIVRHQVTSIEPGATVVTTGGRLHADAVVLAAGWSAGQVALPGSFRLAPISPVKGQIIRLTGTATASVTRVTRGSQAYIVPSADGVLVGATMQAGASDREVDAEVSRALHRSAAELIPVLAEARVTAAWAGIRGATADGLPLAGPTSAPGLFTALAPRRNGWMLAPLVGEVVASAIAGEPLPPHAATFRPDRFDPA